MGHIIDARYLDDGRMEGQFQPGRQEVLTWSSRKGAVRGQSTRALCKHLANRNESIILSAWGIGWWNGRKAVTSGHRAKESYWKFPGTKEFNL